MAGESDLDNKIAVALKAIDNEEIRVLIRQKIIVYIKKEKDPKRKDKVAQKLFAISRKIKIYPLIPSNVNNICNIIEEKHNAWQHKKIKSFYLYLEEIEKAISEVIFHSLAEEGSEEAQENEDIGYHAGEKEEPERASEAEVEAEDESEEEWEEKSEPAFETEAVESEEAEFEREALEEAVEVEAEAEALEIEQAEEENEAEEREQEQEEESEAEELEVELEEEEQEEEYSEHTGHEQHMDPETHQEHELHQQHETHQPHEKHDAHVKEHPAHLFLPLDHLEKEKFFKTHSLHQTSNKYGNEEKPIPKR